MRKRPCRPVDGIFLLDKPREMTSNRALQEVKHRYHACKAGHTGSLDPLATGLLPICLGEATKVSQYLLDADKSYRATIRLGISTTTYDAEGEAVQVRPVAIEWEEVVRAVAGFVGPISQRPPVFSAIKQGGQPLYKKARAGQDVEVAPRPVIVHEARTVSLSGDVLVIDLRVSKGTYIRSFAHDLGERLGCGAHISELRRTALGRFTVDEAHALAALQSDPDPGLLLPADVALGGLPAVNLTAEAARSLSQGQRVFPGKANPMGAVRIYGPEGAFLGIGEVGEDGWLGPKRLRAVAEKP